MPTNQASNHKPPSPNLQFLFTDFQHKMLYVLLKLDLALFNNNKSDLPLSDFIHDDAYLI
jgi:hypothetical protein